MQCKVDSSIKTNITIIKFCGYPTEVKYLFCLKRVLTCYFSTLSRENDRQFFTDLRIEYYCYSIYGLKNKFIWFSWHHLKIAFRGILFFHFFKSEKIESREDTTKKSYCLYNPRGRFIEFILFLADVFQCK